ncbi:MAG: hypothetical protein WBV94_00450 [Blastocatellia bacterium]
MLFEVVVAANDKDSDLAYDVLYVEADSIKESFPAVDEELKHRELTPADFRVSSILELSRPS